MLPSFGSFEAVERAWRALVADVLAFGEQVSPVLDPLSVGSRFGAAKRSTLELLGTRFEITNPRARLFDSIARNSRYSYAIGQTLWALSGSCDVGPLSFYNDRGGEFSDDGKTVRSALGRRVLSSVDGNQLVAAQEKIRQDPSTRRAMIQIYSANDLFAHSRDVPCIGSVHLLARSGKLHAIAHMRSQSALMVLPYDLFVLTMLHEVCAVNLGMQLGSFFHLCDSAHIYEDELDLARRISAEEFADCNQMLPMNEAAVNDLPQAIVAERKIREGLSANPTFEFFESSLNVGHYWNAVLHLLIVDWKTRAGVDPTLREREFAQAALNG